MRRFTFMLTGVALLIAGPTFAQEAGVEDLPPVAMSDNQSGVKPLIPEAKAHSSFIPPGVSENAEQTYLSGIDELPDNWRMIYGPFRAKNKSIRYSVHRPNGFIDFSCSSDGRQEVAIGIAGFVAEKNSSVTASVSISDVQHDLILTATNPVSKNAQETILYASGSDVGGLINTLSRIHSEQAIDGSVSIQAGNRILTAPSPVPYQEAVTVSRVCSGWHNHSLISPPR